MQRICIKYAEKKLKKIKIHEFIVGFPIFRTFNVEKNVQIGNPMYIHNFLIGNPKFTNRESYDILWSESEGNTEHSKPSPILENSKTQQDTATAQQDTV